MQEGKMGGSPMTCTRCRSFGSPHIFKYGEIHAGISHILCEFAGGGRRRDRNADVGASRYATVMERPAPIVRDRRKAEIIEQLPSRVCRWIL